MDRKVRFQLEPPTNDNSAQMELANKANKFRKAVKYVSKSKEAEKLIEEKTTYEAVFIIYKLLTDQEFVKENNDWSPFAKYDFDKFIINMWAHLALKCAEFDFNSDEIAYLTPSKELSDNEKLISIFDYMITILYELTQHQFKNKEFIKLNQTLLKSNLIDSLLAFYSNEQFLNKTSYYYDIQDAMIGLTKIIQNLTENYHLNSLQFKEKSKSEALLNTLKNLTVNSKVLYAQLVNEIELNLRQKNLLELAQYLNKLEKESVTKVNEKQVYIDLLYLYKLVKSPLFNEHTLLIKYNYEKLLVDLLNELYDNRLELELDNIQSKFDYPNMAASLNECRVSIFRYVLFILNFLSSQSIQLCLYFKSIDLIEVYIKFISDELFVHKLLQDEFKSFSVLILNINMMSKIEKPIDETVFENKTKLKGQTPKQWPRLALISSLVGLIQKYKQFVNEKQIDVIYETIVYLVDDAQIENLAFCLDYVNILLIHLNEFGEHFKMNFKFNPKIVKYLDDNGVEQMNEFSTLKIGSSSFCLFSVLNSIYRLSLNYKMKKRIFKEFAALREIIKHGNEWEKLFCLKIIVQLSFDYEISQQMHQEQEGFITQLKEMFINEDNMKIRRLCEIILYSIGTKSLDPGSVIVNGEQEKQEQVDPKSLMISFDSSSKQTCFHIKNELEKMGFKVSMNIENTHSLEAVHKLIKTSSCVLLAINESYRLDEMCQYEAKYAFRMHKPLIVLALQEDYENVQGWLGLFKEKIRLNFFHRSQFEKSFESLKLTLDDMQAHFDQAQNTKPLRKLRNAVSKFKMVKKFNKMDPENWVPIQVAQWLSENQMHASICKTYSHLDGFTLKQLFQIHLDNPQFFHQTIMNETQNQIELSDMAFFIAKLRKLFIK